MNSVGLDNKNIEIVSIFSMIGLLFIIVFLA